jgi:lactoylglutathione lyase
VPTAGGDAGSMKFAYTILYVSDVTRAIEFYERAFGFERGFIHESGEYGELQTGATTLSFASLALAPGNIEGGVTPTDPAQPPPAFEVAFATDDVLAAFARATAAGAVAASPPKQKPWGQTVAYVRDLNGNLVELCTPIS